MSRSKKKRVKRKQGAKSGKVIRINKLLHAYLQGLKNTDETWSQIITEQMHLKKSGKGYNRVTMWTLPSMLVPNRGEALGWAIEDCARDGRDLSERETPVRVVEG